jgi:hypothetical protein
MADRIDLPRDELERLYVAEGLSSNQIAEIFHCHPLTVRARMREYGISLRPHGWQRLVRHVPESVITEWPSARLAYAVGLIASDGYLDEGNNCVILTTTDFELVQIYQSVLGVQDTRVIITHPDPIRKTAYIMQICDYAFRTFIEDRGLTPKKSLTIGPLEIPDAVFVDFLRGELDGDGSWYVAHGWRKVEYLVAKFTSGSRIYLEWLQSVIERLTGLVGRFSGHGLVYNGYNAEKLGEWLYYATDLPCLTRKREKWVEWMHRRSGIDG